MIKPAALVLCLFGCTAAFADELPRTITVSGFGSVETPPDRATLILSIVARDQSVATAQAEAAEVTAKVLALLDELDIPDNRVDTMSASVRPDYRWNREKEEQELRGYIAERQMRVEVHDLSRRAGAGRRRRTGQCGAARERAGRHPGNRDPGRCRAPRLSTGAGDGRTPGRRDGDGGRARYLQRRGHDGNGERQRRLRYRPIKRSFQ